MHSLGLQPSNKSICCQYWVVLLQIKYHLRGKWSDEPCDYDSFIDYIHIRQTGWGYDLKGFRESSWNHCITSTWRLSPAHWQQPGLFRIDNNHFGLLASNLRLFFHIQYLSWIFDYRFIAIQWYRSGCERIYLIMSWWWWLPTKLCLLSPLKIPVPDHSEVQWWTVFNVLHAWTYSSTLPLVWWPKMQPGTLRLNCPILKHHSMTV